MKICSPYIDSNTRTFLLLTIGRENLKENRWKLWDFFKSTQFPLNISHRSILYFPVYWRLLDVDFEAWYEAVGLLHVGLVAAGRLVDAAELRHHSVQEQQVVRAHPQSRPGEDNSQVGSQWSFDWQLGNLVKSVREPLIDIPLKVH